jgi:hypothetical protein
MVVQVIDEFTPETGVADILISSIELIGILILAGILLGVTAGGIFVTVRQLWLRRSLRHNTTEEVTSQSTMFTR